MEVPIVCATPHRPRSGGPPRSSPRTSAGATRSAGVGDQATPVYQHPPIRDLRPNWRRLGAGVGIGAQGAVIYVRPAIGVALVIVNVTIPLIIALVIFITTVWGRQDTCDRVYRLMRMIANRPEPPEPSTRPKCGQLPSPSRRGRPGRKTRVTQHARTVQMTSRDEDRRNPIPASPAAVRRL